MLRFHTHHSCKSSPAQCEGVCKPVPESSCRSKRFTSDINALWIIQSCQKDENSKSRTQTEETHSCRKKDSNEGAPKGPMQITCHEIVRRYSANLQTGFVITVVVNSGIPCGNTNWRQSPLPNTVLLLFSVMSQRLFSRIIEVRPRHLLFSLAIDIERCQHFPLHRHSCPSVSAF